MIQRKAERAESVSVRDIDSMFCTERGESSDGGQARVVAEVGRRLCRFARALLHSVGGCVWTLIVHDKLHRLLHVDLEL